MPSIGSHLAGARVIAARLSQPAIDEQRGAYYLGATAPDLRRMTRQPRHETHFYALDDCGEQDSVARMFAEQPDLAQVQQLDAETTAFVAGYLTHLLMDQRYIERIYREYFGARSGLGGGPRADLLDRLLQYELDRREREGGGLREPRDAMASTEVAADVRFIERETLRRWREVAIEMASHPPTWERWARTARRHVGGEALADEEQVLREVPELLREVIDHVTEERIRAFMEQSIEEATARVREYLRAHDG